MFIFRELPVFTPLLFAMIAFGNPVCAQQEPYRPQFHFSPERNWMNDPNGLLYYEGEYHLFFQHNPFGIDQWNLSWGHAVSRDLVRWEELPVALLPTDDAMIFSGSAVVDWKNTSGFQTGSEPPMVAIYTGFTSSRNIQDQRLAYSNDRGRTWTHYEGNPVIPSFGDADFRDPKVFWHVETNRWVMVITLPTQRLIRIYSSPDLKNWTQKSDFSPPGSKDGGAWECPDLFKISMRDEPSISKWVMVTSMYGNVPAGGWGYQYFIGNFDGTTFVADPSSTGSRADDIVLSDFENENYGDWKVTGTAFGNGSAAGGFENQQAISGYKGLRFVNSFLGGDSSTGKLISPDFNISKKHINFLIGGGGLAEQTCINLIVDGKIVRTAIGANAEALVWRNWNVAEYLGKTAVIEIVDSATGDWGHVNVDQITFSDLSETGQAEGAIYGEYGPDNYAPTSWGDIPTNDGRRLWIGWMTNIQYLNAVPTNPWRGNQSVPRELNLVRTPLGLRLSQKPVEELKTLRGRHLHRETGSIEQLNEWLKSQDVPKLFDCEIDLKAGKTGSTKLILGNEKQQTIVVWNRAEATLAVDRSQSGNTGFSAAFPKVYTAPLSFDGEILKLRLVMDTASLEVFAEDGTVVLSSVIFPDAETRGFTISGPDDAEIVSFDLWEMGSRYTSKPVTPK